MVSAVCALGNSEMEVRYIELKTGFSDNGPAWIARVKMSKSKRTIYFNNMALKAAGGQGIAGNYYDLESGNAFWISGIKRSEWNRHWAGGGDIMIERSVYQWYLSEIQFKETGFLHVIDDLPETDVQRLSQIENAPFED